MKASYELLKAKDFRSAGTIDSRQWFAKVGKNIGHQVLGLLDRDDQALVEHGLLTPRFHADGSGIGENNAHMTDLGIKFCENIETYHVDLLRSDS